MPAYSFDIWSLDEYREHVHIGGGRILIEIPVLLLSLQSSIFQNFLESKLMSSDPFHSVSNWLSRQGLGQFAPVFAANDVDLDTLSELTYDHLREMGLPLGACLRIHKALEKHVATEPKSAIPTQQEIVDVLSQVVVERRQVTVMFCDIVDSTKLATKRDPEEMRSVLLGYWQMIEATTLQYQGYIAQHLGDGALIYFGYPTANENDAERAILAGLAVLKAVSTTTFTEKVMLQVRIGLATGTVVINQFKGGAGKIETLAIGQSVNFASRLQSFARPGNLVTDAPTRALVEGLFLFEDLGLITIDGFSDPAPLFKVLGTKRVRNRFEARRRGAHTRFFGRKTLIAQALKSWNDCIGSRGQLLLITGEPGIGKSRFVQELIAKIGQNSGSQMLMQCSAHSSGSPLFPVTESLSILANTASTETRIQTQDRLRSFLAVSGDAEALLLDLFEQDAVQPSANPQQRRKQTLFELVEWFAAKCMLHPLLLVIEDLHLCDPTTLEFLDLLSARCRDLPLLIVATARPEFDHEFGNSDRLLKLSLSRLDRRDTDDLVREVFGAKTVSAQLLDIVAERTDGVPLFVEELLKSLVETGAIAKSSLTVGLNEGLDSGAIPRSLLSILTARLDKLRGAKRTAQIAACIGREFSFDLLQRVASLNASELQSQLAEISASDLIVSASHAGAVEYSFRHALVRDAAYESLLFSERQAIHGQIADALSISLTPIRPEILAHHLTLAHRHVLAIQKWCEAGDAAKLRSADAEAVQHLKRALSVVEHVPQGAERDNYELTVLLDIITPLRAAHGFAAADVANLTARAIALADKAKDASRILPLLYNRWVYSFVTSHRSECEPLARDILDRSTFDETNFLRMTGLRAVAATQFTSGNFSQAAQNFDASIAVYDAVRQTDLTQAVGLDGKVTALGYCALTRWCLGQFDLAHDHAKLALATAKSVNHVSTTIFAIYHQTLLAGVLERNGTVLKTNGRMLQDLGQEHGLAMWLICGKLLESLGECLDAPSAGALTNAEAHFNDFADMGIVYRPTYYAFLAEICLRLNDTARGLGYISNAKSQIQTSGERWNEAEIFRLEGLLSSDGNNAECCIKQARDIALTQGAVAWLSRADDAMLRLNADC